MNFSVDLRRAAREPLLHFLLLGSLVFGADHVLSARRGDPQTLTVGTAVEKEAREIFRAGMKREPTSKEMKVLLDRWIDNEVLYREGLALGLDRGDGAIRERVIFKALSVTQAGLALPKIDEAGLRAWFEARHDRYDVPARYDFLEAVLVGDAMPPALGAFVEALNGKRESAAQSDLRVFRDRPRANLIESYGGEFTAALERLKPGEWQALPSIQGLRVVRLESVRPGSAARFEDMKDAVLQDWKDDTMALLTTQAVREMGRKYALRNEAAEAGQP
jgi:hypothetical protein